MIDFRNDIVESKKRLLFNNFENLGFFSTSTLSIPINAVRRVPVKITKKDLNAKIITINDASWYTGFNANRAGLENIIERPRSGMAKYNKSE